MKPLSDYSLQELKSMAFDTIHALGELTRRRNEIVEELKKRGELKKAEVTPDV